MTMQDFRGQGPPGDIGSFQSSAKVIVYSYVFSGTTYTVAARQGDRGWVLVDYGTVSSTVTQSAINSLTLGRTNMEKVAVRGNFTLTATITLVNWLYLDLTEAVLTLANGVNTDMIDGTDVFHFVIEGGHLEGNKANQATGHGMYLNHAEDFWVLNMYVTDCKEYGIRCRGATLPIRGVFAYNYVQSCGVNGFQIGGADMLAVGNSSMGNAQHGFEVTCTVSLLSVNHAAHNTSVGFYVYEQAYTVLVGCMATGANDYGFYLDSTCFEITLSGCVAIGNTTSGISLSNSATHNILVNCDVTLNGTQIIPGTGNDNRIINCYGYTPRGNIANPYPVAAGNLNDTAGAQAFPTSNTVYTINHSPKLITIYGGIITSVSIDGVATGQAGATTFAAYQLTPGQTLNVVWTGQPSSVVYAQ